MTSLSLRATSLRERLTELSNAGSNVTETNNLEGLRVELAGHVEKVRVPLEKQELLTSCNIAVSEPASLITVRKRAAGIIEKFVADMKAATLKKGQGWTALLREIDTASSELSAAVLSSWRGHRAAVFAGDTPTAVRGRLARTKKNDEAFATYQALYGRLKAAFDDLPIDKSIVDLVKALAIQLEQAAKAFDFDVPVEVKRFLEAVQSVDGAPIVLLTPQVKAWLEVNGSLESYAIRSTGRG